MKRMVRLFGLAMFAGIALVMPSCASRADQICLRECHDACWSQPDKGQYALLRECTKRCAEYCSDRQKRARQ